MDKKKHIPLWITVPDRVPLYIENDDSIKKSNKDDKPAENIPLYIEVKDE